MNQPSKLYFSLVTCLVTFINVAGDAESLIRQFPASSPDPTYPVNFLNRLRESAAQDVGAMVKQSFPPERAEEQVKILDVLIDNIVPLGLMSNDEFFGTPPAEEAPVAVDETAAGDAPVTGQGIDEDGTAKGPIEA